MAESFFESFIQARMRKMYPDGEVHFERSAYGNWYNVHLRISERDVVQSRLDREATARLLDARLFPPKPKARKHWSLFRGGRRG